MKPDLDTAEGFLRALGPPRPLVAIHPDSGLICAATPRDRASLRRFLTNNSDKNLYFSVNRARRPLSSKPRKPDIKWFDFAHAELDPPDGVADLSDVAAPHARQDQGFLWPPSFFGLQAMACSAFGVFVIRC